jgi:ribosomal protein S18 acetylase RimI-like enzyme
MNAIRFAPTTEEHIEGLHAVIDEVAKERRYLAMLEAPPLEEMRKFVLESIAAKAAHFVALNGAEVVGWCDTARKLRPTLRHSAILGMGVARSYRGRGIGLRLMEAVLADAKQKGFTRVELMVRLDNEPAKKLYEKAGFSVEGLCRRYMLVDGEYYDGYLMAILF